MKNPIAATQIYEFQTAFLKFHVRICRNIENSEFTDNVTVTFSVRENTVPLLQDKLTQLSNGKYIFKEIGEKFAKVE